MDKELLCAPLHDTQRTSLVAACSITRTQGPIQLSCGSRVTLLEVLSRRGDGVELCVVHDLVELNASNLRPNRRLLQVIPRVHFL